MYPVMKDVRHTKPRIVKYVHLLVESLFSPFIHIIISRQSSMAFLIKTIMGEELRKVKFPKHPQS